MYKVKLEPKLYNCFKVMQEELKKGNKKNEKEFFLIKKAIDLLKIDYKKGAHISKKNNKVYKYYFKKYSVQNLWKLDASSSWRIIYTVQGTEIEILSIILESLSHKEYDRRFGY